MPTPLQIIFYIFATIAVCAGVGVITARNPVRSVLSLVTAFFAMAGVWMMLRAEFLSLILVLVYVGAVMTLFLFVVMMLNITTEYKRGGFVRYLPFGIIVMLLLTGLIMVAVGPQYFGLIQMPVPASAPANYSNTEHLGRLLYTEYAYAFEIAGVILLAAIIASITLTHRGAMHRKSQRISRQVAASPENRVHLVNLQVETNKENV